MAYGSHRFLQSEIKVADLRLIFQNQLLNCFPLQAFHHYRLLLETTFAWPDPTQTLFTDGMSLKQLSPSPNLQSALSMALVCLYQTCMSPGNNQYDCVHVCRV